VQATKRSALQEPPPVHFILLKEGSLCDSFYILMDFRLTCPFPLLPSYTNIPVLPLLLLPTLPRGSSVQRVPLQAVSYTEQPPVLCSASSPASRLNVTSGGWLPGYHHRRGCCPFVLLPQTENSSNLLYIYICRLSPLWRR